MTLESPAARPFATSLDRIWDALDQNGFKPNRRANTFKALCPVHADGNPSLSVRYDASDGKVAVHCFGCNAHVADICSAIGLTVSDLFDAPLPEGFRKRPVGEKVVKRHPLPPRLTRDETAPKAPDLSSAAWVETHVYEYVDASGVVQQRVRRFEVVVDGVRHKDFRQEYRSPKGTWVKRRPEGFAPLLYNLPAVLKAAADGGDVWLLEGEKDVDNAVNEGLVATTNSGGASTFPDSLLQPLIGARVHLVVDNDLAGFQRAVSLTRQLTAAGVEVTTYLPAPTERKADFTDHLDTGGTTETLVKISLEDAEALTAAAEATKALGRVVICRREAIANLEATEQDNEISEQRAERWARESAERFDRIASMAPVDGAEYSERGAEARGEYYRILSEAADVAAETFTIAGLTVPARVAAATTEREAAPAGADATETPKTSTVRFGEPGEEPPASGDDGSGDGVINLRADQDDDNPFIIQTEFDVVQGITVRVQREELAKGGWRKKYFRIMGGWGEVLSESVEDDGSDSEVARPAHTITVKFFRPHLTRKGRAMRDPATGELITDKAIVKFSDEQVRDGSWARALPWPDFLESTTRNALTTAWSAIYRARPTIKSKSTVFTSIGWRETEQGPMYVHAGGAITRDSVREVDVDVPAPYAVCTLPEPLTDKDEIRQAWLTGTEDLRGAGLLQRVVAPLLGHVWGSILDPSDMLVHVVGGRASFKSAHARVAAQYIAPGLHFRGAKEMLSGSNMGTTTIGLLRALGAAAHAPVLVDDFAPDGDAKRAQKKLNELARAMFNGSGRITGKQRGGINADERIRVSVITTGELTATGSADTRILNLPLDPRSTENGRALFARLESRQYRDARGRLGATLVQWVAKRRDELLAELEDFDEDTPASKYSSEVFWEKQLESLPHDAGLLGRLINAAVSLDRGISLMLRMLRDFDAITPQEARDFYAWAREGIYDAICRQESSAGDPAEALLAYLREAIASRQVHITEEGANYPREAEALGWVHQGVGEFSQWTPKGNRLGVIKRAQGEGEDRLYLFPSQAIATANTMAARADETFSETPVSIGSALVAHGWVTRNRNGEAATPRRFDGQQVRVWDIPLSVFLTEDGGSSDGDDRGHGSPDGDGGMPPALFDSPGSEIAPDAPDAPADSAPPLELPFDEEPPAEHAPEPQPEPEVPAPAAARAQNPAPARPAPQRGGFRASVAVLHTDGIWFPDGERIDVPGPIVHVGQLAQLASHLRLGTQINSGANKLRKTERGQIYITKDVAIDLGIPFGDLPESSAFRYLEKLHAATEDHPFILGAREDGFQVSGKNAINPSIECWDEDNRDVGVLVSFLPAQHPKFQTDILGDGPDPATIARRLQIFTDALRFPYRKNPSTTGLDLMIALHPKDDREKLFAPMESPRIVRDAGFKEIDFDWQRQLTEKEQQHTWLHAFDRGGSYLAATAGLDLPVGAPTHYPEGVRFTAETKLPGYWKITAPEPGDWRIPDPIATAGRMGPAVPGTIVWVTTPTIELAAELELELEVHEAYLWHEKKRLLGTWQERMRDAREVLDIGNDDAQRALALLKGSYVAGLGITASEDNRGGMLGYAPVRYWHIIAKSRANIIRRIRRIGGDTNRWPVAVVKDTIIYTSNEADPAKAWPGAAEHFGHGLGQYKYEGSDLVEKQLELFTGQGNYKGKRQLELITNENDDTTEGVWGELI